VAIGSPGELRRRELGGTLYEFEVSALGAALIALRQAPDVIDAAIFGDKLHVLLPPASVAADLVPMLARQGISAGAVHAIAPSLEDVFVRLVSGQHTAQARV